MLYSKFSPVVTIQREIYIDIARIKNHGESCIGGKFLCDGMHPIQHVGVETAGVGLGVGTYVEGVFY